MGDQVSDFLVSGGPPVLTFMVLTSEASLEKKWKIRCHLVIRTSWNIWFWPPVLDLFSPELHYRSAASSSNSRATLCTVMAAYFCRSLPPTFLWGAVIPTCTVFEIEEIDMFIPLAHWSDNWEKKNHFCYCLTIYWFLLVAESLARQPWNQMQLHEIHHWINRTLISFWELPIDKDNICKCHVEIPKNYAFAKSASHPARVSTIPYFLWLSIFYLKTSDGSKILHLMPGPCSHFYFDINFEYNLIPNLISK